MSPHQPLPHSPLGPALQLYQVSTELTTLMCSSREKQEFNKIELENKYNSYS